MAKKDAQSQLTKPRRRRRASFVARMRANFLTGVVVILPIGLTIWLIWSAVGLVDNIVMPLVPRRYHPSQYIGIDFRGVGVIIFLVFTVIIGWLAKGFIGRSLLRWGEGLVDRMPVVRSVYSGIKQIAETVFAQAEASFDRACLVEYPRRGIWSIGFISTDTKGEVDRRMPKEHGALSIFLPTTPNPTSGFLLFAPEEDVIILDMSVEEAAKLVISAGLVYPNPKERTGRPYVLPERNRVDA